MHWTNACHLRLLLVEWVTCANMVMREGAPIVFDIGSFSTKYGWVGSDAPRECPTLVGANKKNPNEFFAGCEAASKRPILKLLDPVVSNGVIQNFQAFEKFIHYLYSNDMRLDPTLYPALLCESVANPINNKEKSCQIFFEDFNVPFFAMVPSALCSLSAYGRESGVSVEIGHEVASIVPIFKSKVISKNNAVTDCFIGLLAEHGYSFTTRAEYELAQDMKHKHCFVASDFEEEVNKYQNNEVNKEYELPDGNVITIGSEQFRAPEILFQPQVFACTKNKKFENISDIGLDTAVYNAIQQAASEEDSVDLQKELYQNIALSGGTCMLKGMVDRLNKDVSKQAPMNAKVKIVALPDTCCNVWIGGTIFASLSSFDKWCSQAEYEEHGPSIVHKKWQ